ncbi:MAG: hypothetical protein LC808_28770 [Actinobacteria bacterium]|nr:hypothetical protein [Actinomycetota bacterium]
MRGPGLGARTFEVDPGGRAVWSRGVLSGPVLPFGGYQRVMGTVRTTSVTTWAGGPERAMVVDGYTWTAIPCTDYEVRALAVQPLALRYRPRGGITGPHSL